jgi:hypothetical protein
MFPSILGEKVFSLGQAEATPAIAFVGDVAPDGRLMHHEIILTKANATRLSYADADALLAGEGDEAEPAKDKAQLSKLLQACSVGVLVFRKGSTLMAPFVLVNAPQPAVAVQLIRQRGLCRRLAAVMPSCYEGYLY